MKRKLERSPNEPVQEGPMTRSRTRRMIIEERQFAPWLISTPHRAEPRPRFYQDAAGPSSPVAGPSSAPDNGNDYAYPRYLDDAGPVRTRRINRALISSIQMDESLGTVSQTRMQSVRSTSGNGSAHTVISIESSVSSLGSDPTFDSAHERSTFALGRSATNSHITISSDGSFIVID